MKCLLLINPVSGRGKAGNIARLVKPLFHAAGYEIVSVVSSFVGEFRSMALSLSLYEYDKIVIIGGDGSLNEFVNGMMERDDGARVPLGLIPAGTGNSLMYDLGLLDPMKAAESITFSGTRKIDLLRVTCGSEIHYAFNVVGWGIPSTINQKSENWKVLGGQRYNLASLQEIVRNPCWPVEISLEEERLSGEFSFFMACNTVHTGKGMKIAPRAKLDDGLVDVVMLRRASRGNLIGLFSKIFKGEHVGHPLVSYRQVSGLTLNSPEPSSLIIDGQVAGSTPFELEVLPRKLEIWN